MKPFRYFAAGLLAAGACVFGVVDKAGAGETETLERAVENAMAQIAEDMAKTNFRDVENVAVTPLWGESDAYAQDALGSAISRETRYDLYTRDDEVWGKLLAELEWSELREDVMNKATIQKFGSVAGVDAIVYGTVWRNGVNMWNIRGSTKVSVHVADVETGEVLWSSGPVEGEAYIHWSEALTRFWRYPLIAAGMLVALAVFVFVVRGFVHVLRHAVRPL